MPLTDVAVRNAKPRPSPYKLTDGEGLSLLVSPSGGKHWRFKYRIDGKEKALTLGSYPHLTLAEARERRALARRPVPAGDDPAALKLENEFLRDGFECGRSRNRPHHLVLSLQRSRVVALFQLATGQRPTLPRLS